MGKNTIIVAVIMLIVGFGAGYVVTSGNPNAISKTKTGTHMMSDGSMMQTDIDQHFIVQMIPHHDGAIVMAKIALKRSTRPEILSLANGIIEAQEKEIGDMTAWYRTWFGTDVPEGGMGGMHMDGMTGDTSELESVPASEFDREFINQMIPHHEMAVMMAQMLQSGTERAEMKGLADQIITTQSREIQLMRNWLQEWF